MKEVVKILMERDGMSQEEAETEVEEFKEIMKEMAKEEASLSELEDEFMNMFRLEPDYLVNFIVGGLT